jgi:cytochrome d ubiquinol oxidase subunit II
MAGAFLLAVRGAVRGLRPLAGLGVAALVWAWAVAQYPYLLPFSLTISEGAAASVTLGWLLAWSVVALLVVAPALTLLFLLDQRTELGEDPTTSRPDGDDGATRYPVPTPTGTGRDAGGTERQRH